PPGGSPAPEAVTRHPAGPARTPATHGTGPPTTQDNPSAAPQPQGPSHDARPARARAPATHGTRPPTTARDDPGPAPQPWGCRAAPRRPGPHSSRARHRAAHDTGRPPGGSPAPGAVGGGAPAGRYPRAATLSR